MRCGLIILLLLAACGAKEDMRVNSSDRNVALLNGICYYRQQPFSGELITLSAGGDTMALVSFLSGKEYGRSISWYDNGQLKEKRYYENGRKTGLHEGYWPNGNKRFAYHFEANAYEGNVKEWTESGLLYKDFNYHNGHEEGLQRLWYDNGKLAANYEVIGGRRYGLQGTKSCMNAAEQINIK